MAGQTKDLKLDTRRARREVAPGRMGLRVLTSKLALGYRKEKRGSGQWWFRIYLGRAKRSRKDGSTVERSAYRFALLGLADDFNEADGDKILNYDQAVAAARSKADKPKRKASAEGYTIADAVDLYLAHCRDQDKPSTEDIEGRARRDILPAIGSLTIASLEEDDSPLEQWLGELARAPVRYRGDKIRELVTDEQKRSRKASANKSRTILVSALNYAVKKKKIASDAAWASFKPYKKVDQGRLVFYSEAELRALLAAADSPSGFADLVMVAASTGMRLGELTRLRVEDYNKGRLFIGKSKSGHSRHVAVSPGVAKYIEKDLIPRAVDGVLLPDRRIGRPWTKSAHARPFAAAKEAAGIDRGSFHTLRHSFASALAGGGVSLLVIASQLGHRSTKMTERYSHLSPSSLDEAVEAFAPKITFSPSSPKQLAKTAGQHK